MKTKEEVLALFRAKYGYLQSVCHPIKQFEESLVYQLPDGGWQIDLGVETFGPDGRPIKTDAAITLRPDSDEPHETHGGICNRWYHEGGAFDGTLDGTKKRGWLGHPISDEEVYEADGDSEDRISHFENGDIVWRAKKPEETHILDIKPNVENQPPASRPVGSQHPSALELPPEVKAMLGKIDAELAAINTILTEVPENTDNLERDAVGENVHGALAKVQAQRRAFDSKAFFIVTFGMVKAGKSTLVNTFVGKLVSPMGSSKETTLRCSIVMAADEGHPEGIYLYSPRHPADPREGQDAEALRRWSAGNGRHLIEHLSGLSSNEEFGREIELTARLDFSVEELDHILTTDPLPKYPNILPPVIRIDVERLGDDNVSMDLLREGVAILDTPGLDGARTNAEKDPFWDVLPVCGDYFLLVQSSMSAINKDCLELVRDIYAKTKSVPILAVFNEFAANFWLLPEEQKKKLREDSETAAMELARHLRTEVGGKIPQQIAINAGEAASALPQLGTLEVAKSQTDLLDESRILILRKRILETIRSDRIGIKVANSSDRLMETVREKRQELEAMANTLETEGKERKGKKETGWESADKAASSLANEFEDEGEGIRVAQKVGAKFTEWLDEQFPKQCIVDKSPNYQGTKGKKDNHASLDRKKERNRLENWCQKIAVAYGNVLRGPFVNDDLRRKVEPWQTLFVTLADSLGQLKTLRDKAFEAGGISENEQTFADRQFPDSMFKNFNEDKVFIDKFKPKDDLLDIPPVTWWQGLGKGGRRYGKDNTVWECDCDRAVKKLTDELESHYCKEASKDAGSRLEKAILDKGKKYARDVHQRLTEAIARAKADEKDWQEKNTARVRGIRHICERLASIERILERS